jgi:hypothetical protein
MKMLKVGVAGLVLTMLAGTSSHAQFGGMGKLLKKDTSPTPDAGASAVKAMTLEEVTGSQDKIANDFMGVKMSYLNALALASEAFGNKTAASELKAQAEALKTGATTSATDKLKKMDESKKISEEATKEIAAKLDKKEALSEEGKKLMIDSAAAFCDGTAKEATLVTAAVDLFSQAQKTVESAPLLQKKNALAAILPIKTIATEVPGDLKAAKDVLAKYVDYFKSQNISMPANATSLLEGK